MGSKARQRIIEQEQDAVDRAHRCLERQRGQTERLAKADAAASAKDSVAQRKEYARWIAEYEIGGQQLVVQRVDLREEGDDETFYVGRRSIRDESGAVFVVKWTSPAAVRWRRERGTEKGTVTLRRRLRCRGARVVDYHDELVRSAEPPSPGKGSPAQVAAAIKARKEQEAGSAEDPFLHQELERSRDGLMRDIVETIHRDQLDLVCHDRPGALVIQGGPGTGKTAIGLHRVTWLLDNDHFTPGQILVVGPSRHFLDYVSEVLPSLGTRGVTSLRVDDLCPGRVRGHDTAEQHRTKSDARMAEVLRGAVRDTVRQGAWSKFLDHGRLSIQIDEDILVVDGADIERIFDEALGLDAPMNARRQRFTDLLVDRMIDQASYRQRRQGQALRRRITSLLAGPVNATWPRISETRLYRRLLDDPQVLARASEDVLTDQERAALHRPAAGRADQEPWSSADLLCMEELRILLDGDVPDRYRHIVVDEAQNLTPMQLRALTRRCPSGSLTVLGDLAQSTGTHGHPDWSDLTDHLELPDGWELQELTLGYRIPSQVMHTAVPAAVAASDLTTFPETLRAPRDGELAMTRLGPEGLVDGVRRRVHELLAEGRERSVAVIADDASPYLEPAADALREGSAPTGGAAVRVLAASEVSGLEFDHVVLVEPREITDSGPGGHGRLYVALTRCTQTLTVLHTGSLPDTLIDPHAPAADHDRTCTRHHADGRQCRNRASSPDGWCRQPGCDGYRTERVRHLDDQPAVLHVPAGLDTAARLEDSVRADGVTVGAAARARFAVRHRAGAREAEAEIRAMLGDLLTEGRQARRTDGHWHLERDGYRLVLDRAAASVVDYQTVHAERSWAQYRAGVVSRISQRAQEGTASPEHRRDTTTERTEDERMRAHTPPVPPQGGPQDPTAAEQLRLFMAGLGQREEPQDQSMYGFLRHSLIADLYRTGNLPAQQETGDVLCEISGRSVLYRVLPHGDTGYGRLREVALEALEARWAQGVDADRVCLVLPVSPKEDWSAPALLGATGVSVIWREEDAWRGGEAVPVSGGHFA
ncbi:DNA helicase IV [Nocardiopsis arvandica]|uniref:DNA helicase IV n=1 Tax=Nocardiopsis sinuspersici TaxID=501010 RepID=A0A7Z0BLE2_9ACTN|nr:UvrD-helicase domain-containing protein [Nocardiopsis sinuspersici]NYH55773.1 DNA helicase IV [Nocardiopsis sinuspersici]